MIIMLQVALLVFGRADSQLWLSSILNNIVSAPTVSTYGVSLPTSKLTCEPLLLSVFNLASNVKVGWFG